MAEARGRGDSFIVRIWWEEEGQMWRGWVQHAGTGQMAYVQSLEELVAFLQRFTGDLTSTPWSQRD